MFEIQVTNNGFLQTLTATLDRAVNITPDVWDNVGNMVISEIQINFDSQGRPNAWIPSKSAIREGRQTLIKSGKLKAAPYIKLREPNAVTVGMPGLPYENIHNFGGTIPITEKSRKFFWAMYYQNDVNKEMWKSLAITKKSSIEMPKREYFNLSNESQEKIYNYLKEYILHGKQ